MKTEKLLDRQTDTERQTFITATEIIRNKIWDNAFRHRMSKIDITNTTDYMHVISAMIQDLTV